MMMMTTIINYDYDDDYDDYDDDYDDDDNENGFIHLYSALLHSVNAYCCDRPCYTGCAVII
jgi:hypothetical protein